MARQHWVFNEEQLDRALDAYGADLYASAADPNSLHQKATIRLFLMSRSAEKLRVHSIEPDPPSPPIIGPSAPAAVAKVA